MLKKILIIVLVIIAIPVVFFKTYFHRTDLPPLTETPAESGAILIENASVFTGRAPDRIINNASILIKDGKIASIAAGAVDAGDAKKIDASGKMVIPGLIDAHTHVGMAGAPSSLPSLPNPERNMTAFLYAGITSVMDMGGDIRALEKMSAALESGKMSGSRLFYAGPLLTKKGGHPAAMIRLSVFWPLSEIAVSASTRELVPGSDYEKIINENKKHGARMTKVVRDDIPLMVPCLETDELGKIAEVSARAGLPVVAHIGTEDDIIACLDAGIRYLMHAPNLSALSDATIARMKKQKAVVNATLAVYDNISLLADKKLTVSAMDRETADPKFIEEYLKGQSDKTAPALKEWVSEEMKYRDIKFDNVRRMKKAGIPVIAATDTPNVATFPGSSIHRELELLVTRCGFTPAEAVAAATSVPADQFAAVLGGEGFGYVKEGGPADLVILAGDFREDIRNTALIDTVIQRGKIIKRMRP